MGEDLEGDISNAPKVFISYSRKDRERAMGIADALKARQFGVFRDTEDILPTEEWRDRLQELIDEADTIVFLLSPHSAVSEVCAWEVEYAASLNKRIAPIVIDDVEGTDIPPRLARLNFIFCTPRDPFENAVDTLASALNTDIEWVREHTRILGLAKRWAAANGPAHLLLRGQDIVDAEGWRDGRPQDAPDITADQARYISNSRRAAARRQRNWVTGSMVTVAATAALAVFAWFQSIEANEQRAAAETFAAQADEQRQIAETNAAEALTARDRATRNFRTAETAINALVVDIAQGLADVEGMRLDSLQKILTRAQEAIDQLLAADPSNQKLIQNKVVMLTEFAAVYERAGALSDAYQMAEEAHALMLTIVASEPGNLNFRGNLSNGLARIGDLHLASGRSNEAMATYREALVVAEGIMADSQPPFGGIYDDTSPIYHVALLKERIAHLHQLAGRREDALALFQDALQMRRDVKGPAGDASEARRNISGTLNRIGYLQEHVGQTEAALLSYRDGLEIIRRVIADDPTNTRYEKDLHTSLTKLGNLQRDLGRIDEARQAYEEALARSRHLALLDPDNILAQRGYSLSLEDIGDFNSANGQYEKALLDYDNALDLTIGLARRDPANIMMQNDVVAILVKIAHLNLRIGQTVQAEAQLLQARDIADRALERDPDHTEIMANSATVHSGLGELMMQRGDFAEALAAYQRSVAGLRRMLAIDPENVDWLHDLSGRTMDVGRVQFNSGALDEALVALEESVDISGKLMMLNDSNVDWQSLQANGLINLGTVLQGQDRLDEALTTYERAAEIGRGTLQINNRNMRYIEDLLLTVRKIAGVHEIKGNGAAASRSLDEALALSRQILALSQENPQWYVDAVILLWNRANYETGRDAVEYLQEALSLLNDLTQRDMLPEEQAEWPRLVRERMAEAYNEGQTGQD